MVTDRLELCERYVALHPAFASAFRFLRQTDLAALDTGRHAIDGDRLFVLIDRQDGRGRQGARLEAHRRYIDIQLTLHGEEEIGWSPLAACSAPAGAFDDSKDILFYDDAPATWIGVPRGSFAIFFPEDAHAPLGGVGALTKAIAKVAVR